MTSETPRMGGTVQPLNSGQRQVVVVAETLAKFAKKRRFRRRPMPFDFVPAAKEVVTALARELRAQAEQSGRGGTDG